MGLLTIIGVSIMAERIGSKVKDMVEDSHRTDYEKTRLTVESNNRIVEMQEITKRENAVLRAEIARMHEETERANARISAEAKIQAERIRAAGQVATAAILTAGERDSFSSSYSFVSSKATHANSFGGITRNREVPGLIPTSNSESNFCPFCGNDLTPGSFFCRNCGKRIK